MLHMTSRRIAIALGGLALPAALAILLAQGAASASPADTAAPPDGPAFAVLARPAGTDDLDNAALRRAARQDPSLLPGQARLVGPDARARTWLVPGSGGRLCLAVEPGDTYAALEQQRGGKSPELVWACDAGATVAERGLVLRLYGDIVGIVPDGVARVVTEIEGATVERAVTGNVFRASTSESGFSHGSARFAGPDGATVTLPLP